MFHHAATRRLPRFIAIVIVVLALAACSSQAAAPPQDGYDVGEQPQSSAPPDEQPAAGNGDGQDRPVGEFAPIEQRIVKTGEVGLEVENVAVVLSQVRGMALEVGGYVGGSQAGTLDQMATVTLRIPAERFDEVLTRLQELDDVDLISMSTREEDVTGQVVDLEARIRNLEASEASYRALLDRADRIEDILTVQGRLDEVRGEIEQLEAQLQAVEGQAALSTLTVTLVPRNEPVADVQAGWDPGAQAKNAVAALVGLGQGLFDAAVWLVIVVLPILLVVGLIALGTMRFLPEVRRRMQPVAPDPSGDGPTG
jgi:hypothetical protein